MKNLLAISLALILGILAGIGTAALRIKSPAWSGLPVDHAPNMSVAAPPQGNQPLPKVEVARVEYEFGTIEADGHGEHAFVFSNAGEGPLKLTAGKTSCRCTLSKIENDEVAPGASTTVTVSWHAKDVSAGEFRQNATILTNDPARPEVMLLVAGHVFTPLEAAPRELVLGQVVPGATASGEVGLFCYQKLPLEILGHKFAQADTAEFFRVTVQPMSAEQLQEKKDARSGVELHVTVKPGLPQGRFAQTILLQTNQDSAPTIEVPVRGSVVAPIVVVGPGWDDAEEVLTLGPVGDAGMQRRLMLIARGPNCKDVKYTLHAEDLAPLKVTLGETTEINNGAAAQTPLLIEVPKESPGNHLDLREGKPTQIIIETSHPQVPRLRIPVRYAMGE